MDDPYDVLILGAGMAGLAAARSLADAGKRVALIEARERVGGRILSRHVSLADGRSSDDRAVAGGVAVELGAEFIHGLPVESWRLIREAGLETYELDGSRWWFSDGRLQSTGQPDPASVLDEMSTWLAAQPPGTDETFAHYLSHADLDAARCREAIRYVEGFNAADHRVIGIAALAKQQHAENAIAAERIFHVRAGYDSLPSLLRDRFTAAGGRLFLQRPVTGVRWERGSVRIAGLDSGGRAFEYRGRQAVITLPLGVLHAGAVHFDPAPARVLAHAQRMAMGMVIRASLLFRSRFWRAAAGAHRAGTEGLNDLSFLFTDRGVPSTWWTSHPSELPLITAWVGGPCTADLAPVTAAQIESRCLDMLAEIFGESRAALARQLLGCYFHDWFADDYARGAYSYAPAGALDASAAMAEPLQETLYFAGEHTNVAGHWGTVHGALQSGAAAAARILALER